MELCGAELDRIVLDIVREHAGMRITRQEIAEAVLDYIRPRIMGYVQPSIDRLSLSDEIDEDRDSKRGRPYIYDVPEES